MNDTLDAWPHCPICRRPRHTWCPICEHAGHDFPQGDQFTMEDDDTRRARPSLLLICPTCDEPFKPKFMRHCEWCNHDFGNGQELNPPAVQERTEFNARAAAVAAGIVCVVVAVMLYFRFILSQ